MKIFSLKNFAIGSTIFLTTMIAAVVGGNDFNCGRIVKTCGHKLKKLICSKRLGAIKTSTEAIAYSFGAMASYAAASDDPNPDTNPAIKTYFALNNQTILKEIENIVTQLKVLNRGDDLGSSDEIGNELTNYIVLITKYMLAVCINNAGGSGGDEMLIANALTTQGNQLGLLFKKRIDNSSVPNIWPEVTLLTEWSIQAVKEVLTNDQVHPGETEKEIASAIDYFQQILKLFDSYFEEILESC